MTISTRSEIEGYAAVFGEADLTGDRIARGAFRKQLIPSQTGRVRMLYQHQAETPIGVWTHLEENAHGLLARGNLFLDTRGGREAERLLAGGALDGLSIGFKTKKARQVPGGRMLTDLDLWEISLVTFPMSPKARVTRLSKPGERLPRNLLS